MKRLIEQESCEHGNFDKCRLGLPESPAEWLAMVGGERCEGGSSREVTVDYMEAAKKYRGVSNDKSVPTFNGIKAIVDAALGGGR